MQQPETFAVIDLGTNSLRLLIASARGDTLNILYDRGEVTKLGSNLQVDGTITDEALHRNMDTLQRFRKECERFRVAKVILAGTSAMRDARNRDAVLQSIQQHTGFELQILSGLEEAYYTYYGGLLQLDHVDHPPILMDTGGGSTEFIWNSETGSLKMLSEPMGALRFTDDFITHDPPEKIEIEHLESRIREILDTLPHITGKTMVGVGGTITTVASVALQLKEYSPDIIHGQVLSIDTINHLFHQFINLTIPEKMALPGMEPKRADIITAGTAIILNTMKHFNFNRIIISDRGLRFGIIQHLAGIIPPPP